MSRLIALLRRKQGSSTLALTKDRFYDDSDLLYFASPNIRSTTDSLKTGTLNTHPRKLLSPSATMNCLTESNWLLNSCI